MIQPFSVPISTTLREIPSPEPAEDGRLGNVRFGDIFEEFSHSADTGLILFLYIVFIGSCHGFHQNVVADDDASRMTELQCTVKNAR